MMAVVSSVFRVIRFPHEGKLVTIDQLSYCRAETTTATRPNIPLVSNSTRACDNVGVGMYPALMGTFNLPPPISYIDSVPIYAISSIATNSTDKICYFRTSYFEDPWVVPVSSVLVEEDGCTGTPMTSSAAEIAYQAVQSAIADPDCVSYPSMEEYDQYT